MILQGLDRLAPELQPIAAVMKADLSRGVLAATRASLDERRAVTAASVCLEGVDVEDVLVGSVRCRLYRPAGGGVLPVVVYFHGGAFVLGNLDTDHASCVALARDAGVAVLSVDYRLAPEHPYPAAVEDGQHVLRGLEDNAVASQLDPSRLAVAGSSAGAGLAAVLALWARDADGPAIAGLLLHQPALDDRCVTPSMREFTNTPGFDSVAAELMWRYYAGDTQSDALLAAARAADVRGLPATLITCSDLDPLRDEALDFARRLLEAGVPTQLHVHARTCHGFDSMLPDWSGSQAQRTLFAAEAARLKQEPR